ncbi:hypothetical protein MCP_1599 [Methanocella paludicola SANAE]|uniref:Uncharacterized protein n=1 Tax=Methanocella paludicola (strain DSM 17711 / JCM 13418 / NBRC 101707 / SANAE) TaxID=304371 RepID=D1YYZ9_METPS|nr:tetratricopeptide repeat protein [Methanocella paludicola]BAI61671.1 hypothetical protein MCP_1599 [Methanocella paludicola SANAE]
MNLGVTLIKKDMVDDGLKELEKAIELNPQYADAYYELGSFFEKAQDVTKARGAYESFVKYASKDDERVERISKHLVEIKEREDAEKKGEQVYQ